ncbi:hypothetical protein RRG08_063193 [Elysia crispata]|uniref:Uncharacterized protein n=1 Tax=Elysia crispata TaxID=231223 RepID=A0AAE0YV09_9GAST|nr:hypothetical protein RRG08_063193 [Elysia crispata]
MDVLVHYDLFDCGFYFYLGRGELRPSENLMESSNNLTRHKTQVPIPLQRVRIATSSSNTLSSLLLTQLCSQGLCGFSLALELNS